MTGVKAASPQELALVVGHHADAVHLERVQGVRDLAQAAFDIRHRYDGEEAEATGWSAITLAPKSLHSRASARAAS